LGRENVTLDVLLDVTSSSWISPYINSICEDAKDATYARREELEEILAAKSAAKESGNQLTKDNLILGNNDIMAEKSVEAHEMFFRSVKSFAQHQTECNLTEDVNRSCVCGLELCVGMSSRRIQHKTLTAMM